MLEIKEIPVSGYEKVIEVIDSDAKLHGFIAVHNTVLGPALGGVRMYPYRTAQDGLDDALRLAASMTSKSAIAEIGLGGGKSVIFGDPHRDKTERLFLSFGEAVNTLKGQYIAAEDVGIIPEDLLIIRRSTPYVAALPTEQSSGDPSIFTAWGVFHGIQAVATQLWGSRSIKGKRIAVQGLGHVGSRLADILFWEGAELILTDLNKEIVRHLARVYGAEIASPQKIHQVKCDIFSPCAMGGVINDNTLPELRCQAVAGSANNQLADPRHGTDLMKKGILYAPDYIINSGGVINAATEFNLGGYDPKAARERMDHIYDILCDVFVKSKNEKKPTSQIADEIAEYNLAHKIGQRKTPIGFDT